jgi:hypothetical protein
MPVPMVFEIVAKCILCVLLVPLDLLKTSSNFRAFLQPCYANLFPQWFATVTVKGNDLKSDCDGELMHKVVELLPVEHTVKRVGKGTKYHSYIFAFAVNHSGMEKNVMDEYIVSVAQKFAHTLNDDVQQSCFYLTRVFIWDAFIRHIKRLRKRFLASHDVAHP